MTENLSILDNDEAVVALVELCHGIPDQGIGVNAARVRRCRAGDDSIFCPQDTERIHIRHKIRDILVCRL